MGFALISRGKGEETDEEVESIKNWRIGSFLSFDKKLDKKTIHSNQRNLIFFNAAQKWLDTADRMSGESFRDLDSLRMLEHVGK